MNTNLLKFHIAEAGLTCKDVEKELGISHSAFSRKLNHKSEFNREEIEKLAALLHLTNIGEIFFAKEVS